MVFSMGFPDLSMGFPDPSYFHHPPEGAEIPVHQQNPRLGTSSLCNLGSKALGATVWEPQTGVFGQVEQFFFCVFFLESPYEKGFYLRVPF